MSSKHLPPIRHLPQWTRDVRLEKPWSPRRVQPLPAVRPAVDRGGGVGAEGQGEGEGEGEGEASCHRDADPRVASMQRNIQFLQQQHKDTLEKLHAEIEYLRRENKELQYKMIMETPRSGRKVLQHSRGGIRPPTQVSEAPLYLEEPLQDTRPLQDLALSIGESSEVHGSPRKDHSTELKGGLITSLQPLRIHSSPSHPPRAPTLQECEVIIRQLYNANSLQSQEILRVKALLRDIVLSKKITPENYILTKAYLVDGTRKPFEEKKFPKLGLRSFPEKTFEPSLGSGVVLPALKQSLSSNIAERQRRARAVQRDRFKRTVQ